MLTTTPPDSVTNHQHVDYDHELYERSVNHAVKSIQSSNAGSEPFSHFHATNIIPEDFYQDLLKNLPDSKYYKPLNIKLWVDAKGNSTRDRLPMTDDEMSGLPADQYRLWSTLRAVLHSDEVRLAAYHVLRQDICARFGIAQDKLDELESHPKSVMLRDNESYSIKPHSDGLVRIITMMYYMPSDLSQQDMGTSLYVKKPIYQWINGKRYREVKRFPYMPNSIGAFAVSRMGPRTSWHGVERIGPNRGTRHSIACQFTTEPEDVIYKRQAERGKY